MERLPLLGGSYSARSIIANCQRAINLFPETNPKDSPVPLTHYQRPGLVPLVSPDVPAAGRFIYQASNGDGYCVIGSNLYYVSPTWALTLVGALTTGLSTPASIIDNGIEAMVVDGSANGWQWSLADKGAGSFSQINDASFTGADRVDYIDTFVLWNIPGTNQFRSTLSNQITPMDALYIASKTDYPDPLVTGPIVNRHEILLPGLFKSEIWYDAGNPQFPFAELPGAYIEHGGRAKYSYATADIATYWLGRDLQSGGQGMVFRQRGYECVRISNHALEYQIRLMAAAGTVSDAIGYTYQQDGHVFYVLSFPSGNQTWAWDETIGDPMLGWTQRCWTEPGTGKLNRDRTNGQAALYGKNVVLDWENGTLYALDLTAYTDTVGGVPGPITYLRTFPHLLAGIDPKTGQAIRADGQMVQHTRFMLDVECGTSADLSPPPQFSLRWSDDRGRTWGETVLQSAGTRGQYITRPEWSGLGMAMDRVYELSWSFTGQCALNGAWVEGKVMAR